MIGTGPVGLGTDGWGAAGGLEMLQALVIVAGGIWAVYVYRTSRRGQTKLAIAYTARLMRDFAPGRCVLVVRLILGNTSDVLWFHEDARVTLFDARRLTDRDEVRLVPFTEADPFLPVYGVLPEDVGDFAVGEPFHYFGGQEISLEPGEQVHAEIAFTLDQAKLGLMGMKVRLSGRQRRGLKSGALRWLVRSRLYEWAAFFYVDPTEIAA